MSLCPDCQERRAHIRSNVTGDVLRCTPCEDAEREKLGLPVTREFGLNVGRFSTDFKSYWLEDGNLDAVEREPEFDKKNRRIYIKNKRHEEDMCRKMDCHFGERGEKALGFEIGKDEPRGRVKIRR